MAKPNSERLGRRKFMKAAAGGTTASLLAGCTGGGGGSSPTPRVVTRIVEEEGETVVKTVKRGSEVHILTDFTTDSWQQYWDQNRESFQEETGQGVNIEYTGVSTSGVQRLGTLIQSGAAPEVYYGGIKLESQFALQNQFTHLEMIDELFGADAPLGELIFESPAMEILYGPWVFPMNIYLNHPLVYRRDIYEELGLSEPANWSELLENVRTIDEADDIEARGIGIGGGAKAGNDFQAWLRSNDAARYRWTDDSRSDVEVWFPEDKTIETMEFMQELRQYAPDPAGTSWGDSFNWYASGRVAHVLDINAWHAQVAAGAENDEVAQGTDVMLAPPNDGVDPVDRGFYQITGPTVMRNSDNVEGGKEWIRHAHGSVEKLAQGNSFSPLRLLPTTKAVFETDTYTQNPMFEKYPNLLDVAEKLALELAPHYEHPDRPITGATMYTFSLGYNDRMIQDLWSGQSPQQVLDTWRPRYREALAEGKDLAAGVEEGEG